MMSKIAHYLTETAEDNHLVCKRKIDHLAKLAYKWFDCVARSYM